MNKCYGENLTVDGVFGSKTTAALKRTQTKIGVTSDGIYGVKTHNKMKFYEDDTADGGPYCAKVEAL
ncbi:MAG: peptidoglycan-binding protein [Micropruina sp.]|nr:peptidoglycan-binding protein [Micropruina sp.]